MEKGEVLKRYGILTAGLLIMALGITLSTKANLGISPISCIPYILSLGLPLTFGVVTFFFNILLILTQVVILRKDFQPIQLLQILSVTLFSVFTDLTMFLVSGIQVENYLIQIILLLMSCVLIGLGICFQIKANVLMLPGEGLVDAIRKVSQKEFGKIKVSLDITLVLTGACISLLMFQQLSGVREGTIISALMIGMVVRFFVVRIHFHSLDSTQLKQEELPLTK